MRLKRLSLPTAEPSTVPANDGLGSDDRQGISQVRKQAIEADEDHPVEAIEAEPLRRDALQDNELRLSACFA